MEPSTRCVELLDVPARRVTPIDGRAIVQWRVRGCGCLALSVRFSRDPAGWQLLYPGQPIGSIPVPSVSSALGAWTAHSSDRWIRHGRLPDRGWMLPTDPASWPRPAREPMPSSMVTVVDGLPDPLRVFAGCPHMAALHEAATAELVGPSAGRQFRTLAELLVADFNANLPAFLATRRIPTRHLLPPSA